MMKKGQVITVLALSSLVLVGCGHQEGLHHKESARVEHHQATNDEKRIADAKAFNKVGQWKHNAIWGQVEARQILKPKTKKVLNGPAAYYFTDFVVCKVTPQTAKQKAKLADDFDLPGKPDHIYLLVANYNIKNMSERPIEIDGVDSVIVNGSHIDDDQVEDTLSDAKLAKKATRQNEQLQIVVPDEKIKELELIFDDVEDARTSKTVKEEGTSAVIKFE